MPSNAKPKAASNQVDRCYTALRELIVTCEFAPGTRLNEKALIERLNVGRTPIREALLRLSQDGLLEVKQRSGYIVRPLDRKCIEDVLITWGGVVPIIISAANRNMNEETRLNLLAELAELSRSAGDDPTRSSFFSGHAMSKLIQIADNEPLEHIYRHLEANLERISRLLHFIPHEDNWSDSLISLAKLIEERDAEKAANAARNRVAHSSNELITFLDNLPDYSFEQIPYITK